MLFSVTSMVACVTAMLPIQQGMPSSSRGTQRGMHSSSRGMALRMIALPQLDEVPPEAATAIATAAAAATFLLQPRRMYFSSLQEQV